MPVRTRTCLCFLCFWLLTSLGTARAGKPPRTPKPPARPGREIQVLDDAWKFQTDPQDDGETLSWQNAMPDSAKATILPALWTVASAPDYTGTAWYWRTFDTVATWKGQTVRLRFEAVAEKAHVWLNGKDLGEHVGGATPFEFNITTLLNLGSPNTLAMRVQGAAAQGAGIWQGVLLLAHDEAYLADIFPQVDRYGHVTTALTLLNTSDKTGDATLDARISSTDSPSLDVSKTTLAVSLTPGRNITNLLISVGKKKLQLWTPETPVLYNLTLLFHQAADNLDADNVKIGFRDFGWAQGAVTLNGTALKTVAVAPHLSRPIVLSSTDDVDRARTLLRHLKAGGANLVYLDAPPPALLRLADEEGLLVIEGARPSRRAALAQDEMRALITRDRSHPCILGWQTNSTERSLVESLRLLDASRFILTGIGSSPQVWAPGQAEPIHEALPTGLLPPH